MTDKHNYKLTDAQFIEAYRASEGNYSQTAKYIREHFGIPYTKQSAQERAQNHPEEIEKMYSLMENESLTAIMDFARDITLDIKLRARLYVQVMIQINRRKRLKIMADRAKAKAKPPVREGVFKFGNYILRFPGLGDHQQLTPEEAKKERLEILENINREFARLYPKPDAPLKTTDNEQTKNKKTGSDNNRQ